MNEQIKNIYNNYNKEINKSEQYKKNNMMIENNNVNLQVKLGKLEQELYIATGAKKFDYGYSYDKYSAKNLEELFVTIKKATVRLNLSDKQRDKNYLFLDEYAYYMHQCELAINNAKQQNKALSSSNALREDIYFIKSINKSKDKNEIITTISSKENESNEVLALKGVLDRIDNKIKIANRMLNSQHDFSK